MNNNPDITNGPSWHTTIYYNSSGVGLLRTTDNNKFLGNAVTFIPDDHLDSFGELLNIMSAVGVDLNGGLATGLMRSLGESYDVMSAFDLVDANSENYSATKDFIPDDGKAFHQ